ncbi:copper resistance protein B [Nitrogeniibacter aestuarii]|uniref:copper resistance protein B n=1 Tax=Nitrogeniibacter aestuarii TaxID=2815343 RepID=UPI001D0FE12A|nr:copper resistance protein B [Nitrogeniibacter aestuarii]
MKRTLIAAALLWLSTSAAIGQAMDHSQMDHAQMDHSQMDHGSMPHAAGAEGMSTNDSAMDHGSMDHGSMDHGSMDHGSMDHGSMDHGSMDHGSMDHGSMDHGSMDHGSMDHGSMDHGSMDQQAEDGMDHDSMEGMDHGQMQGGSPPADARDPHAYSGGYTLTSGPHLFDGAHPPHTADMDSFATLLVDRLERVDAEDSAFTSWDAQARIGRDFNKLVIKSEGEYTEGALEHARTEFLWSHAVEHFWDLQLGWRHDSGEAPDEDWLAIGLQGLAPYWFEVDAAAYIGKGGQTALRLEGEYELLITQRLVLQPRVEFNAYGKRDETQGVASGPADLSAGVRLRYEFSRQFAPYVGVEWKRLLGGTADLARDEGGDTMDTRLVAGVRFWF